MAVESVCALHTLILTVMHSVAQHPRWLSLPPEAKFVRIVFYLLVAKSEKYHIFSERALLFILTLCCPTQKSFSIV